MNNREVLFAPFDVETHKKTFINYLEVVILEDGTIEYAVPSHQKKATSIACKKLHVTEQELADMCPQEFYFDYNNWLCKMAGCVMVWNEFTMGERNEKQAAAIERLKKEGLYRGN
jgi:hypothetical protein